MRFVVVGNPGNKRIAFFQEALQASGLAPAPVVPYAELIAGSDSLARFPADGDTIIRFEAPERNFEVEKALIAAGAEVEDDGPAPRISATEARGLVFDKGRILYPRQWYLGLRRLFKRWEQQLACPVMNHPADIPIMFDKRLCHQLFTRYGIPAPVSLGEVHSYDELRQRMADLAHQAVFIKLACGSSASGVVAYRVEPERDYAFTSVERIHNGGSTRLYNSRKIRRYTRREEIADIINILAREGVQVEAWLPKARLQGQPFDVRVVVIAGQARHVVVRFGRSPLTNLHLDNRRGTLEMLLTRVKPEAWAVMKQTCERAAGLFPRSLYGGVDLLVGPDFQAHAILEINAFGDLLYETTWNGLDTYAVEIQAVLARRQEKEVRTG